MLSTRVSACVAGMTRSLYIVRYALCVSGILGMLTLTLGLPLLLFFLYLYVYVPVCSCTRLPVLFYVTVTFFYVIVTLCYQLPHLLSNNLLQIGIRCNQILKIFLLFQLPFVLFCFFQHITNKQCFLSLLFFVFFFEYLFFPK